MTRSRWQDLTPEGLRIARKAFGVTQAELGEALGLEPQYAGGTVRRWELGSRAIPGTVKLLVWLAVELPAVKALLIKKPAKPTRIKVSAEDAKAARRERLARSSL